MGRTFENRKQAILKRGARDSKAFTRCARQINMAVKAGGADPDGNPALRRAMQNARAANMPKDKIQNAIDKALGVGDSTDYQPAIYEGYGPHGVAIIVDAATDNPTRTVANIRNAFKKEGGNLGNAGSVSFMFDFFGVFRVAPIEGAQRDEVELELIDHGLEQMFDGEGEKGEPQWVIRCARDQFGSLQAALESRQAQIVSARFEWVPKTTTELAEDHAEEVMKLVDRLQEDDDVQDVFCTLG
jgi:YebC/PmpR family DNA-binding regulatory protein